MKIKNCYLFLLLCFQICIVDAVPNGVAGPLTGNVQADGVTLWMYASPTSVITYTYQAEGSDQKEKQAGKFTAVKNQAAKVPGQIFKSTMNGLAPDTRYQYQVSINGKADPKWKGSLKTAPVEGTSTAFRMAITSCMHIKRAQRSWNCLLYTSPSPRDVEESRMPSSA